MKILTNYELKIYNKRIDEISDIIDICSENDQDIINNLELELENILKIIKTSINILESTNVIHINFKTKKVG